MRGLLLLASGIKNNFKQMLPIIISLVFTIGFAFALAGFFSKNIFGDPNAWSIWLIAGIVIAILCAICMTFVYSAYFKVSAERFRTARVLGARYRDIVVNVIVEAFIIYLLGVVVGTVCDTIINSMVCLFGAGEHVYLVGKTFLISAGITLVVPFLATSMSLMTNYAKNKVFCINK